MAEENQLDEVESGGAEEAGAGRRRFIRRPRVCQFCSEKARTIDHKQVDVLRRFVSEQGKIRSRRETGACARHQRMLSRAIKRARHLALVPFSADRVR